MRPAVLALVLTAAGAARADEPAIVDMPIPFDEERERLTLEYRRAHEDPEAKSIKIVPRAIVIHHTGSGSMRATFRYFSRTRIERGRGKLAAAGAVNVAAHFLVDRDGTIWRLLPETRMGRHAIGLNHDSIGIENVGDGGRWPLTDAQLEANAALVRYLAGQHPITHLLGHHETARLRGHALYVERDARYRDAKGDPGPRFMRRLRERLADLKLEGPPEERRR